MLSTKKIIVKSSDGKSFEVDEAAALEIILEIIPKKTKKIILKSSDGQSFEVDELAALEIILNSSEVAALETKKIILKSSDGDFFEVDLLAARESELIKHLTEDVKDGSVIPLPNVDSKILPRVIEYCEKQSSATDREVLADKEDKLYRNLVEYKFRKEFAEVDQATLFDLILLNPQLAEDSRTPNSEHN